MLSANQNRSSTLIEPSLDNHVSNESSVPIKTGVTASNTHALNQTGSSSSTSSEINKTNQCQSAALVAFGLPKSFQYVWKAYLKHIVKQNPHIKFKAYMHMYDDLHQQPFPNERSQEKNVKNGITQNYQIYTKQYSRGYLNNSDNLVTNRI